MCVVMHFWNIRNFNPLSSVTNTNLKTELKYDKSTNKISLTTNRGSTNIDIPSSFNNKKIVIRLTENSNVNIRKAVISNHATTLTQASAPTGNQRQNFGFTTEDRTLHRLMYSKNFYDFDSEQYHRIIMQGKLSGSYVQ